MLYTRRPRPRGPRVHHRPARASRSAGIERGGRGEAPDGLRLPRADGVVPGAGHADDRADRERAEGGARPVLRRADRHPRARSRQVEDGTADREGQRPEERAPHGGRGDRRRLDDALLARGRRPSRRPGRVNAGAWPAVGRVNNVRTATAISSAPARRSRAYEKEMKQKKKKRPRTASGGVRRAAQKGAPFGGFFTVYSSLCSYSFVPDQRLVPRRIAAGPCTSSPAATGRILHHPSGPVRAP
ncbi:MAG: hypothetical protein MZV64_16785 [Ignavibacteriales bacterium]|nr:hypothetical protein [Ignavibacteriales bacterium]